MNLTLLTYINYLFHNELRTVLSVGWLFDLNTKNMKYQVQFPVDIMLKILKKGCVYSLDKSRIMPRVSFLLYVTLIQVRLVWNRVCL